MSYAKLKQICKTVSSVYTDNRKFIPENSKLYDKQYIYNLSKINYTESSINNNMPEDLKTFDKVYNQNISNFKKNGGCNSCGS
jgi:hypothetical protein|tara:strand:+ start:4096 stop:4344 length:249 start_codon:yes stop_codon:yes gene_type:complete